MWAKHLAACGVVSASLPLAFTLQSLVPLAYPYLPFLLAVLLAGSVFDQGSGYVAVGLSALFAAWLFLPPVGYPDVHEGRDGVPLALFVAAGTITAAVMEALHRALVREKRARAELVRSERQRRLLLSEFRHRTRNDLQSLAALLLLRARSAPSQAAADGLREAAEHARALARAHAWLAHGDAGDDQDPARVDTKEFVEGFCRDLGIALFGGELRPVALIATAEAHTLDSERAVHLGLALNELVTNALKYAFPDDGAGTVRVRFAREGESYVLSVWDDGVGMPADEAPPRTEKRPLAAGTGLGTRLLQGLAAQLRGTLSRGAAGNGAGTSAELRFPVAEPGGR
jgi:two-component sensor histidine kinase